MRFTWVAPFCYALRQVVCDVTRNCPDVCPTDLMKIGLAIDKLGAAGEEVQSLFHLRRPRMRHDERARTICFQCTTRVS